MGSAALAARGGPSGGFSLPGPRAEILDQLRPLGDRSLLRGVVGLSTGLPLGREILLAILTLLAVPIPLLGSLPALLGVFGYEVLLARF